jgi:hypothetical protein
MEIIWNYLLNMGCTQESAAGIMGNFAHESGSLDFNTASVEVGNGNAGYGIAQWSYTRRTNLEATAVANGVAVDSLDFQLEFFRMEVLDAGGVDYYFGINTDVSGWTEYITLKDVNRAMKAFEGAYERSSAKAYSSRLDYAIQVYQTMTGKTPAT